MVDENFVRRLAQDLVKIDSSDPGAYEGDRGTSLRGLIESNWRSLIVLRSMPQIKEFEVLPGRHNLWSPCRDWSDEPRLVYICHMDTVTLGRWLGRGYTAARGDRAGRQAL